MKSDEITAGTHIRVPAGADLIRKATYYGRVLALLSHVEDTPMVMVRVQKLRADGTESRRRGKPVTIVAFFDPADVTPRVSAA